jgi:hypothetical protein
MSTNMTVSWRLSTARFSADHPTGAGASVCSPVTAAPHALQNRLPGGFSLPQSPQRQGSGAPQSPQNLLMFGTSVPQRGQIIRRLFPDGHQTSIMGAPLQQQNTVVAVRQWSTILKGRMASSE